MRDALEIRLLGLDDQGLLECVAEGLFDGAIDHTLRREFLDDDRHHIAVAIDDGMIVSFVSGVHYVHPDKPAQMFINEVSTAATHRRRGIGRRVLAALLDHAQALGCSEAWVLTDRANVAAQRLYAGQGGRLSTQA